MTDIAVAHTSSPYVSAYPWSAGFGSKYSDPGTTPTGTGRSVTFGASDIAVAHLSSPYVSAYPWSAGFGSKYSNPGTPPASSSTGVAFNASDIAVSHASSPYVSAYPWSAGFGSKYSDPGTTPVSTGFGVALDASHVAVAHAFSPYVSAYPWSAGFGSKYSDPGTTPTGQGNGVAFGAADIVVAHQSSPYVSAYPWSAGFGSKYSNPGTLPPNAGGGVVFGGSDLAVAHTASPYVSVYPWSAGFGSKYSNPSTLPTGDGRSVAFDASDIAVSHASSPYVSAYPWSAGFGSKYTNPGTLPTGDGFGVAFSPGGGGGINADVPPAVLELSGVAAATTKASALPAGAVAWTAVEPVPRREIPAGQGLIDLTGIAATHTKSAALSPAILHVVDVSPATTKAAAAGIGAVDFLGIAPAAAKAADAGLGLIDVLGLAATTTKAVAAGLGLVDFVLPALVEGGEGGFQPAWTVKPQRIIVGGGLSLMYPKNAASPEPIAIGAVVQISDGAVQTSGCTVRIKPIGVAEGDGGGTTAYSTDGIVLYTPTQAETNYTSFILIAKKTGCIPVCVTVIPSGSATAGHAALDWGVVANKTTTNALTGTTIATTQKVDVETIKTQAVTCGAGVTVLASVGTAATSTAQTGDSYAIVNSGTYGNSALKTLIDAVDNFVDTEIADIQSRLPAALGANGNIKADVRDHVGTAVATPDTAGYPKVTIKSGTGTGELNLSGGYAVINGMASNTITSTSIASNAITSAKIADGAIDRATFAADTGLQAIRSNTAQAGASGSITLDASADATDDFYNDCLVLITGGTGVGQVRTIGDYTGSTQVATVSPNWVTNPDNTSTFAILPAGQIAGATAPTAAQIRAEMDSNSTQLAAIVADTNELQTDWVNGGRLDLILDSRSSHSAADVWASATRTLTAIDEDSTTLDLDATIRGALGMSSANLDTQLSNLSSAIDAVDNFIDTEVASILQDTGTDIPAQIAALLTTAGTESYRADGATGSVFQLLYETIGHLGESSISGTTKTVDKVDGSTPAMTFTLDDGTTPTAITRAT